MLPSSKFLLLASALLVLLALTFISSIPFTGHRISLHPGPSLKHESYHAPRKNIWADLDEKEATELIAFLHTRSNELNLTKSENATSWDNQIALVEVLQPNKTDVLPYLDEVTNLPARWARLVVSQGASPESGLSEYMVGPLPPSERTTILPLEYCYNSGRNYSPNPIPSLPALQQWLQILVLEHGDIILDLLTEVINHGNRSTVENLAGWSRPAPSGNGRSVHWVSVGTSGGGSGAFSLGAQGLYIKIDISGRDMAKWSVLQWYYNGILYESTQAFREAWKSPDFEKTPPNLDGDWTLADLASDGPPGRKKPGPVMIQPSGPRYDIDHGEKHISWMGYEFYLSSSQVTGVTLHDVKFQEDRIMYELGLQEAVVQYAANDPGISGLMWLDSFFGMGTNMFELVPGYDCPAYATFLSAPFTHGEQTITQKNNICIFEAAADHPLQRHTAKTYVTVSQSTYLVVRSVSTVGNYDYLIDYIFYLDGSIEVKYRASGYIFGSYWAASSEKNKRGEHVDEYGYRVHDTVATAIHDHVLNFKADLDVAGTANTLVRVDIEPVSISYPWEEAKTTPRNTMRLRHSPVLNETGLNWQPNSGTMYVVLNNDTTNAWGEKRGYRIMPGTGMGTPSHLTVRNSPSLGKGAQWVEKDLWVLKRKDTEPRSANEFNFLDPESPILDFAGMVDGEGTEQEDLVIYFNLGSHHVPHSGDIPNTLMHTSTSSIMFTPHNFHDRDPSRKNAQGVTVQLGKGVAKPRYFGGRYTEGVCLNVTDLQPDLADRYGAMEHAVSSLLWNESLIGV